MITEKRYFTEIIESSDGKVRFARAKRLVGINQSKRGWRRVNSRGLARKVNNSQIVIK